MNELTAQGSGVKAKLIEMTLLSGAFGLVFLIVNYIHFQNIQVSVILYACIWDALIAGLLVLGPYGWFRLRKGPLLSTEFGLVGIASFILIMLYAVMGPTVIDRSLSIYIVQKIDQRGGRVAEAKMPEIFVKEYMPEFRLVDVRMTEQVTSGTVNIENGCVILTPKGKRLSRFANWYRKTLLPRKRVLMGEVSDQLTDPFAGKAAVVDTTCPPVAP
ncbi:hypothetical protein HAD_08590 [Hyphomonas adhaerens MHS-3]|uniref:Uncharacterized protein n=1 Tax=Hyphomonas adhaerens MHS-3 TaxID=1280949 RepID=A0A069E708_9PROT|nr:hypothetical protein [Hyphomonas adhaerens]KCZ85729.1 hypothetical protein HAD_08590 [Hyphomonas adhaerens MHS-3]